MCCSLQKSKSLSSLFKKRDVSDLLINRANRLQKNKRFSWKIRILCVILTIFPPLLCPRANCSRLSSLICSFLKSNLNDLLPSLFTKDQSERFAQVTQTKELLWAIRSHRSLKKSESVTLSQKKSKTHFRSFAHKNRAIRSKYWWANSQPWDAVSLISF